MTPLMRWAEQYQVSPQALQALLYLLGTSAPAGVELTAGLSSEAGVQQQMRLSAAQRGDMWLTRNNSGACKDDKGRMIRYGLCNESEQMNKKIKSSDLIGITRVVCRCGWVHGVFTALEAKHPGWSLTPGDKRGQAQLVFGQKVISMGGIFRFVTDPSQVREI